MAGRLASVLLLRSRGAGARVIFFFFLLSHIREPLQRRSWSWGMTDMMVGPRARHLRVHGNPQWPSCLSCCVITLRSCCGRSLLACSPAHPPFCICISNLSLVPKTFLPAFRMKPDQRGLSVGSIAIISGPTAPPGGQCRSSRPQLPSPSRSRGRIQVLAGFLLA